MRPNTFRAALAQNPDALNELSDDTLLRYTRGNFPKVVQWLLRYPSLLRALAEDGENEIREQNAVEIAAKKQQE